MDRHSFHPLITRWFCEKFGEPSAPQDAGWPEIATGRDTLIAAPTGTGKTLAAFLWSLDSLIRDALAGELEDACRLVYISPLKALGNDIQKNLQEPLSEMRALAREEGVELPEIRVAVRSGDTPARERRLMLKKRPHILITTPESLYILLTAERSRKVLETARAVIVDEIHAVAGDKRGAHLALSLERLDALCNDRLQRIGLSATQKPIDEIARLLIGAGRSREDGSPDCAIVDVGHKREMALTVEVADQDIGPIASHEYWAEVFERIAAHIESHRTTIVFVHTRRLAERVSHRLTERLGEGRVAAHHGSLSRKIRLDAEERLKSGALAAIVATASLELGIDIGHVDLVCHLGAPRTLASLLQRVGRSGHWKGAVPKGIVFPLTRDELLQSAAAIRSVRGGALDLVVFPKAPLDILAQQMVAEVAAQEEVEEEALWSLIRRAQPYGELERSVFEDVLEMLSEGISTSRGRRTAYLHRDRVNALLRPRRGARLCAITSGGAIPDTADYDVVEGAAETFVGKVNEDFAIESNAGDIFLLGNHSWRVKRVERGKVRVEDAEGLPPNIPFWLGEAPSRTAELSEAVSALRSELAGRLDAPGEAIRWMRAECGLYASGASQLIDYVRETVRVLGRVPTQGEIVAERFFDEAGGMQLVIHSPYGGRINRAWGHTLRKRFCLTFDFELQAAATDDGIVLSLSSQHSFPLESIFGFARLASLKKDMLQSALQSPMFTNRWRWNATRALALPRRSGGKKVPVAIQRMRAEDLLAAVFPAQLACQDNHHGPIEPPDHPLVNETVENCLTEAMDIESLRALIAEVESGKIMTFGVETPAPSLMSHEILNANPYAFIDDAPLEERRSRAVPLRRALPDDAESARLDPDVIEEVCEQAWPAPRDADELHDALLTLCVLPVEEAGEWSAWVDELLARNRLAKAAWQMEGVEREGLVPAERMALIRAAVPGIRLTPEAIPFQGDEAETPAQDEAALALVRGWMEASGPVTAEELASRVGLALPDVNIALAALEGEGAVLRGRFARLAPEAEIEWCDRVLLARIHRMTLGKLRREIEPVTAADFIRYLLRWQHVHEDAMLHGRDGVLEVIRQLQGLELPAPAWEERILPARIKNYDPADLEALCLSGIVAWGRLRPGAPPEPLDVPESGSRSRGTQKAQPSRRALLAFLLREEVGLFLKPRETEDAWRGNLSRTAREILDFLKDRGASFLADITAATGRLRTEAEEALWELVARGLVTGDGVAGLRALIASAKEKKKGERRLRALPGGRAISREAKKRFMPVGRWSLWGSADAPLDEEAHREAHARQLLKRYGVVLRELAVREAAAPRWREMVRVFRRLEAKGEIRGGRFVSGFMGEQFALPEAVEALRAVRRIPARGKPTMVHASDPMNLVGVIAPGSKISARSRDVILYRDGLVADSGPLGEVRSRLANESLTGGG